MTHTLRAVIDDGMACVERYEDGNWVYASLIDLGGESPIKVLRGRGYELDEAAAENDTDIVWLRELPAVA